MIAFTQFIHDVTGLITKALNVVFDRIGDLPFEIVKGVKSVNGRNNHFQKLLQVGWDCHRSLRHWVFVDFENDSFFGEKIWG